MTAQARYMQTPKGRAATARYLATDKRRAAQRRYERTERGHLTARRYGRKIANEKDQAQLDALLASLDERSLDGSIDD